MVAINGTLEKKLTTFAQERGVASGVLLDSILAEWFEDTEDVREAEEVLRALEEGRETVFNSEDLERELGL